MIGKCATLTMVRDDLVFIPFSPSNISRKRESHCLSLFFFVFIFFLYFWFHLRKGILSTGFANGARVQRPVRQKGSIATFCPKNLPSSPWPSERKKKKERKIKKNISLFFCLTIREEDYYHF